MNHASYAVLRGHSWGGGWMAMVAMGTLAIVAMQTSQLIGTNLRSDEASAASAESSQPLSSDPAVARYDALPMVLTIPFAVTHTQQVMVARLKHRSDFAKRIARFRGGLKDAPRLIAGLALIGASQSPGR